MSYTTVMELRQSLGLGSEPGDDALLARFAAEATTIVEQATGKVWEARADTTRHLDARADVDGRTLHLRDWLVSVTGIVNGNGQAVAAGEYVLMPVGGPPYRHLTLKYSSAVAWTWTGTPEGAIAVTGRWATTLTPPADIAAATRSIAAWLYKRREQPLDFDRAVVSQTGETILPPDLPPDARAILNKRSPRAGAAARVVAGRLVYGNQ